MYKKILIANRGEIAVRIIRTCREMGIQTVAIYEASDRGSLHVRLADECAQLPGPQSFMDPAAVLAVAQEHEVEAIHPGYGYLAEDAEFIRACEAVGIAFIGPPPEVVEVLRNKIGALEMARAAGFRTVVHSPRSFSEDEYDELAAAADEIGYPVVIKSCRGGRGRGERVVTDPAHLVETVRRAQVETLAVYGNKQLYVERAILPAHQVGVQILADRDGNLVHLGEREGSVVQSNQKIIEEEPALCLTPERREELLDTAVQLARLFKLQNLSTVEFLVDRAGQFYFSEVKARIQIAHTLAEMLAHIDLVREQIRLEFGEPLGYRQEDIVRRGHAIMCRVQAEDPFHRYLPAPGHLRQVRLPGGPEVRVDTYVYAGCDVSPHYDPLVAKVTAWGPDRDTCVNRMRRALEDFILIGAPSNLPLLLRILRDPTFLKGIYSTDFLSRLEEAPVPEFDRVQRDLAVAAAVLYVRRREVFNPQTPDQWATGWHRSSRKLP
ncbi:acetyl/propionyl/methylcrotonyl-CoA carboxylase subunit alpha [Promineifilum sp.]|uniref:acetyl-CoA carboxylase biotin carboxylase subunit n=1 Tax=Promineifilum sp. TaxID=2664178 RepID=UPI0035AF23C9